MMAVGQFVLTLTLFGMVFGRSSGPFDFIVDKVEKCADFDTEVTFFPTRLSKVTRYKALLGGEFILGHDIDDQTKIYIDVQQWGNQGFRPRSIEYTMKKCSKIWQMGSNVVKGVFESAGVNMTGCPFPAGSYTIKNLGLNFTMPVPSMIYNRYRMAVHMFQAGIETGCTMFYADVTPKQTT